MTTSKNDQKSVLFAKWPCKNVVLFEFCWRCDTIPEHLNNITKGLEPGKCDLAIQILIKLIKNLEKAIDLSSPLLGSFFPAPVLLSDCCRCSASHFLSPIFDQFSLASVLLFVRKTCSTSHFSAFFLDFRHFFRIFCIFFGFSCNTVFGPGSPSNIELFFPPIFFATCDDFLQSVCTSDEKNCI